MPRNRKNSPSCNSAAAAWSDRQAALLTSVRCNRYVVATSVEPYATRCLQHHEGTRPLKLFVQRSIHGLDHFAAQIQDQKLVVADKAKAIGAGTEPGPADLDGRISYQESLVLLFHVGCIPGSVNQSGDQITIGPKTRRGCVAHLRRGALTLKVEARRRHSREFCARQDCARILRAG